MPSSASVIHARQGPVPIRPGSILSRYVGTWCGYLWCLWTLEALAEDLRSGSIDRLAVITEDRHLWTMVVDWAAMNAPETPVDWQRSQDAIRPSRRVSLAKLMRAAASLATFGLLTVTSRERVMVVDHRNTRPLIAGIARRESCSYAAVLGGQRVLQVLSPANRTTAFARPFSLPAFQGDSIEARANRAIAGRFLSDEPQILAHAQSLVQALDLASPGIVVAHYWDGPALHPLRAWAKARGRMFAAVQHGFPIGTVWSAMTRKVDADTYYCWGQRISEAVDRSSNADVEVLPLGNPVFDQLPAEQFQARPQPRRVLIAPSAYLAVFEDHWCDLWDEVARLASGNDLGKVEWTVRLHSLSRQREWISEKVLSAGVRVTGTATPFAADARAADVVITTPSSVVVETIQCGVPVIVWNSIEEPNDFDDACTVTTERRELRDELHRLLTDSTYRRTRIQAQQAYAAGYVTSGAGSAIAGDVMRRLKEMSRDHISTDDRSR